MDPNLSKTGTQVAPARWVQSRRESRRISFRLPPDIAVSNGPILPSAKGIVRVELIARNCLICG